MSERDYRIHCQDILDSGNAIAGYVYQLSFREFRDDRKTYSAVIREFEIIGEAVGNLPGELKEGRQDVEWQDIKDFRNLLIPGSSAVTSDTKIQHSLQPNVLNKTTAFTKKNKSVSSA
jgi:uncharacterized protein with HEPN domain